MEPVELKGPDACLAFLIRNQDEWKPTIVTDKGNEGPGRVLDLPLTLIGVVNEQL